MRSSLSSSLSMDKRKKVKNPDLQENLLGDEKDAESNMIIGIKDEPNPDTSPTATDANNNKVGDAREPKPKQSCAQRVKSWGPKTYLKIFFVLFLITFFTLAGVYSDVTTTAFTNFLEWMQNHLFLGSLAYMLIYTITTVLVIPGSILTLGAGFVFKAVLGIWGVFLASLVVMLGASLGATLAFLLGKTLLREVVQGVKEKYPSFNTIDKVVEIYGLRVTFLLRLSPALPFNLFNYLMGLTSVRLIDYVIALFGLFPGTLAYCFIGASLGELAEASSVGFSDPIVLIFLVVGTTVTIIGMVVLSIYAKKKYDELKKLVEAPQKDQKEMNDDTNVSMAPMDTKNNEQTTNDAADNNDASLTTNDDTATPVAGNDAQDANDDDDEDGGGDNDNNAGNNDSGDTNDTTTVGDDTATTGNDS